MVPWILACVGVVVTAYFAGALLCTLDFGRFLSPSVDQPMGRTTKFLRIFLTLFFALIGLFIVLIDVHSKAGKRPGLGAIWLIAVSAAIFASFVPNPVVVTTNGISRSQTLHRKQFIRWEELDHYEVCKNVQGTSDVYYLRSSDGRTMKINDWTQDAGSLLKQIAPYKKLQEHPFRD